MGFRYITPVEPKAATGLAGRVYRQQAADVGMTRMPALMTLSPVPELLAATWATLREALMAGPLSRTDREVVALGVSMANRCPFCVSAHGMFLHATGDHALAELLLAGGTPADPRTAALFAWAGTWEASPYREPEIVGTALAFHFINRMVSALHTEDLLPGGMQRSRLVRRVGGMSLAPKALTAGESLPLLAGLPPGTPRRWAGDSPVGTAVSTLLLVADLGAGMLGAQARRVVEDTASWWAGTHPPMAGGWLTEALAKVPEGDRPAARLAILAAVAPYRITDADVAAWPHRADADLVRLLAYGAGLAVRRAEAAYTGQRAVSPRSAAPRNVVA